MDDERGAKDAALADMGSRLAGPALRARRRQYDIFVTRDPENVAWDGPPVAAERARLTPSAEADARPAAAAALLASVSGFARQVPWREFGVPARRVAALGLMGAAGFGLVLSDAGTPLRQRTHQARPPVIADIAPDSSGEAISAGPERTADKADAESASAQAQSAALPTATMPALSEGDTPDAANTPQAPVATSITAAAAPGALVDAPANAETRMARARAPVTPAAAPALARLAGWPGKPMARPARAVARPALLSISPAMAAQLARAHTAPVKFVRAMARRSVTHRMATSEYALPRWLTQPEPAKPHVLIMSPQPHMLQQAAAPAPHPVARRQYHAPVYANYTAWTAPAQAYAN